MRLLYLSITLLFSIFLLFGCGFTEETTAIKADSSEGQSKAYVVDLKDIDNKLAQDTWNQFIKDHGSRLNRIKGSAVQQAEGVGIPGIIGSTTVKSNFDGRGKNTELQLWFVQGSRYLTQEDDYEVYREIDRFVDDYFTALDAAQVQEQIDGEEKKLKDLEKELTRLQRDNDRLHKDITRAEDKIRESRLKIEENLKDQDQTEREIQNQRKIVEDTKRQKI